ncbi:arginase family protein [Campylobacter sp. LR291e]|uniref:arginase family protein n=1 Tax=Campylobacter sp. LR291e TaxID=2593546 RepID=UPI00123A67E5|nr:arginase family protein [Campylobacter sp. LR291e]KAA6234304.1 arginase family protein [Campylobacter sp. LR291e]
MKSIRLIYPQWQGGEISAYFEDLNEKQSSQGYILGARILDLLMKKRKNVQNIYLPISTKFKREIKDGIIDKKIILHQTKKVAKLVKKSKADKILSLGGECSISIVPFLYLAKKYGSDDVCVIYLDSHPDIGLPYDDFYQGYHAMAVSMLLGYGDEELLSVIKNKKDFIRPENLLLVGLNSKEEKHYKQRQNDFNLKSINTSEYNEKAVISWLDSISATKLLIHFDLDVLDKDELYIAVGNTGKMKITQIISLLKIASRKKRLVGLSVAECLPRDLIKLQNLLANLPSF